MNIRRIGIVTALLWFGLTPVLVLAHTTATTVPKSGSVLDRSPPTIEINFRQPARLTSVVVQQAGKPERKLQFAPSDSATAFKIAEPHLGTGRNEVKWKALSTDGHVISGTIVIDIKSGAAH